jgi:uncharacterized membrane-anchored protein
MNDVTKQALSRVPAVTLGFWVIKILATTLGETGGDTVTMTKTSPEISLLIRQCVNRIGDIGT